MPLRQLARMIWAGPCSLVGLCLAGVLLALGGRAQRVAGTLEVAYRRDRAPAGVAPWLPFRAITFGHVILGATAVELQRVRAHERVHVAQYERWGILFFALYIGSSSWQLLTGRRAYWDNHFEIDARERSTGSSDDASRH